MSNEQINIETVLKGNTQVEKLVKSLRDGSDIANQYTQRIKELGAALSSLNPRVLAQLGKTLAQGAPQSYVRNSATTGQIRDFEAELTNVTSRIINRFSKGINDSIKAANNLDVLKLKNSQQTVGSGNISILNNQIIAQEARYSERLLQSERLRGAAADTVLRKAAEEKAILDSLVAKKAQLLTLEKERNLVAGITTATQVNNAKAADENYQTSLRNLQQQRILGDGGASLFKIQAQLLVNYMLMNKVFQLFSFGTGYVIGFDKALKELQAITVTTNEEMKDLAKTIVDVSTNSRFSAIDIAKAATTMGQAGFSAPEIKASIGAITQLATATGSDLSTSVDVATSALIVFNMQASEMGHVADVMTGALNLSKLTMDKLSLGIQYAGNTAAEAGITLEELVSALGAMSNAGIKSGSTLGTGLAKMIVELETPSKNLVKELAKVGLTTADVDIKAKGLTGVMQTLSSAGFNASNAFRALDLRGARAYIALQRNLDTMKSLQSQLLLSSAAAEANARQMESLSNSGQRLSNTFGAVIIQFGEPIKKALILAANAVSDLLIKLNELPFILPAIGIAFSSLFGAAVILRVLQLTQNILGIGKAIQAVGAFSSVASVEVGAFTVAAEGAAAATTLWGRAIVFLSATPLGRLASILALATAAIWAFGAAEDGLGNNMDALQANIDKASGKFKEHQDTIDAVGQNIERLIARYADLSKNNEALKDEIFAAQLRFGTFSKHLRTDTITSVEDLIKVLRELQGIMRDLQIKDLDHYIKEQTYMNRQKTRKAIQQVQDYNSNVSAPVGRGDILSFGGGGIGSQFAVGNDVLDLYKSTKDLDFAKLNFEGLQKIREAYKNGILNLQAKDNQLLDESNKILDQKGDTNEVDKARVAVNEIKQTIEERLSNLENVFQQKQNKIMLEHQGLFTDYVTSVDDWGVKLSEARAEFRKAKPGSQAFKDALANIKKYQELRDNFFEDMDKSLAPKVAEISKETGLDPAFVRSSFGELFKDKLASYGSEAETALRDGMDGLADSTQGFFDKYTELQKLAITRLQKAIDHSTDVIDRKISAIDSIVSETSDRRNRGINPIYSDQEIRHMEDKKRDYDTQAMTDKIAKMRELLPLLEQMVNHQKTLLDQSVEAFNNSKGTKGEGRALKSMVESQRDYDSALEEQRKVMITLEDLENKRNARLGTAAKEQTNLSDAIMDSVSHYMDVMAVQNDFKLNIDHNVTKVLDEASGAFSDFVENVATGSKSIGESFRDMAGRIIKAMLDIAAQQAASGLFSIFGSIFKSVIGAVTGTVSGGSGVDTLGAGDPGADTLGANEGGYVKRFGAGGYNPNRDSRRALLRPGEYVLRNSAVDMIGKEALDYINAMGNRRTNQGGGVVASAAAANPGIQVGTPVNVWIISPDQKPPMTKNDVIAIVSEDMVRGGQTRKLLKSAVAGLT